jgi:hypothetical protein
MLLKIELRLNLVSHMQHYFGDDMSWYGKTKLPNFKVGDKVFLKIGKVEIGKKKKLEPKWMGPYSIIESRYNLIRTHSECHHNTW